MAFLKEYVMYKNISNYENIQRKSYFLQIAIFKLMIENDRKTIRKINKIIATTDIKYQMPIKYTTTEKLNDIIEAYCIYLRKEKPYMISGYFSYLYSQNMMFIQGLFRYIELWLKKR